MLQFLKQNSLFLGFAFLATALGNFGQTFFIALYSAELRADFGLSHTAFGGIYSAMTLLSALAVMISGRWIDNWPLKKFVIFVFCGLAAGCLLMSLAQNVVFLAIAIFLLRHFGQGLSTHTAMTAMSRTFTKTRGRAVAIGQLGFPAGESLLPALAVFLMVTYGWRMSWQLFAISLLFIFVPLLSWLSGKGVEEVDEVQADPVSSRGRSDVLRDRRFYMIMPIYIAPGFLLTGMFFHQIRLAEDMNWGTQELAIAFSFYGVCKIIASLIAGQLVDKFSARRMLPFTILPLIAAFMTLVLVPDHLSIYGLFLYLGLCGVNLGVAAPVSGGLWPELYGTAHLGAIRSMTSPIVLLGTALAPVLFGFGLDNDVTFSQIIIMSIFYMILASGLAFVVSFDTLRRKLD